ncbi:MAG TPA: Holliday junction resolvase RuvX [Anaerolineaceae bacterium]|nr:Holliday junction resolvase RuvX [Anaerolineaceae bacterium]
MEKNRSNERLLGVDPGEKRIGISISDPSGTISRPLRVIRHTSYRESAREILKICFAMDIKKIVIGISRDEKGEATFSGRKAQRLGEAIQGFADVPIEYWDEADTTRIAQQTRREMGISRKRRRGHLDDVAACILLQSYIDSHFERGE